MKATRLLCLFIVMVGSIYHATAQCTASDILIQNIVPSGTQTAGTCTAKFDLSFTMESNNGNKFIFLHAWASSAYPDYFECENGEAGSNGAVQSPAAADLTGSFINVGIDNSDAVPALLSTYTPDPGATLNSVDSVTKTILPDGSSFFVLHGVTATFPADCGVPVLITMDFWSSQSANAQVAHCVSCGLQYAINYLAVTGFANCATLTYFGAITNRQAAALTGYRLVYADANGDGFFSAAVDPLVTDTTNFSLAAGIGSTTPMTGSIPASSMNYNLIVVTRLTGAIGGISVSIIPTSICAALPVTFKSFTAERTSRSNALLKWETAMESNNSGFSVLRSTDHTTWEFVAFIPSQANGGNSSMQLAYSFNDVNTERGVTLYRVKQTDLDGNAKFTEVRSVRGNGQKLKTIVYPNPSNDGRVNVVFENSDGIYDVNLFDMTGRMLRQWKSLTGNTLQVSNLEQGMYSLRIIDKASGEQFIEKIVVSRN
jgi:hypothetical protein